MSARQYVNVAASDRVKPGQVYRTALSRILVTSLWANPAQVFGKLWDVIPSKLIGATVSPRPESVGRASVAVIDIKITSAIGTISVGEWGDKLHAAGAFTFLDRVELLPQSGLSVNTAPGDRAKVAGDVEQQNRAEGFAGALDKLSNAAKIAAGVTVVVALAVILWKVLPILTPAKKGGA